MKPPRSPQPPAVVALHRGAILVPTGATPLAAGLRYFSDGLLAVDGAGRVAALGPAARLAPRFRGVPVTVHRDALLLPGFVDLHVHFPQLAVVASPGEELLGWLSRYVFPEEARFAEPKVAAEGARAFVRQLLAGGTTGALVFGSHDEGATDRLFVEMRRQGLSGGAGNVLMDRGVPKALRGRGGRQLAAAGRLAERWNGRGRLRFAVTPRFAVTSTAAQLSAAGRLVAEHPGLFVHTHLSENLDEVAAVSRLFPRAADYLDVYDRAGLLGGRTVLAHAIHLRRREIDRLASSGAILAHCPGSNLFLGSGLFRARELMEAGVRVALGTDVGAGTSLSLLRVMADAYAVAATVRAPLSPAQLLWLATVGGASALAQGPGAGTLAPGSPADFVVLAPHAHPLLERRLGRCRTAEEILFAYQMLGDERAVRATCTNGQLVWQREAIRGR